VPVGTVTPGFTPAKCGRPATITAPPHEAGYYLDLDVYLPVPSGQSMWLTVGQHHVTASAFQGFVIAPGSVVSWTYTVTEPKCSRPITALDAPPSPTVSVAPALAITPALAETGSTIRPLWLAGLGFGLTGTLLVAYPLWRSREDRRYYDRMCGSKEEKKQS